MEYYQIEKKLKEIFSSERLILQNFYYTIIYDENADGFDRIIIRKFDNLHNEIYSWWLSLSSSEDYLQETFNDFFYGQQLDKLLDRVEDKQGIL